MKETKLLNCPFCGGEAKIQRIINLDDFDDFFIMCERCSSRTKKFKAERSAILVWNNRKPMEKILERLEDASFSKSLGNIIELVILKDKAIEILNEEGGIE